MKASRCPISVSREREHVIERLILGLNLVISSDNVGVGRWHALAIRAALAVICDAMLLRRRTRRATSVLSAVVHAVIVVAGTTMMRLRLGLRLLVLRTVAVLMRAWRALNVDVGNAVTLTILRQGLVLVGRLRIFGYDVPCVDKTGDIGETAEEDVDERIGAAKTTLYPD
jgi:hypothetical protein